MKSPFTIEEKMFANDVKRLANGIDKLVKLLEQSDIANKEVKP